MSDHSADRPPRVLGLSYSDAGGGAAIAALRLTIALREKGIDAVLGVVEKRTANSFVVTIPSRGGLAGKLIRKIGALIERFLFRRFKTANPLLHSLNLFSKVDIRWINASEYDIVHLHWVNNDMISVKDIGRITKPLFWTLHDSWPVCGAEHHPDPMHTDLRYRDGYSRIGGSPLRGIDLPRLVFRLKLHYWKRININLCCPSSWEEEIARTSHLASTFPAWQTRVIPNCVDTRTFAPADRRDIRRLLGIPESAVVLGFGSAYAIGDGIDPKGGYLVPDILRFVHANSPNLGISLLAFGPLDERFARRMPVPVFSTGRIENDAIMRIGYCACDVFIVPSLVESFGLTALEASACGVPVCAFRVGGVPDVVADRVSGYLAEPFDPEDFARGVSWCLDNRREAGVRAAARARDLFNPDVAARLTLSYYGERQHSAAEDKSLGRISIGA